LLSVHADKLTEDGRQRLVRHGHLPEREIVTGIDRDSPDEPRTGVYFCAFVAFWQDKPAAGTAVTLGTPNGGRGADLVIFLGIWTHSFRRLPLSA
jgi:hypothetical protein